MLAIKDINNEKKKQYKKNWIGPSSNTIRERIINELKQYIIHEDFGKTLDKTYKIMANQVIDIEGINRMNIPMIALVLVLLRKNSEDEYEENINIFTDNLLLMKDVPSEQQIKDGILIDIIRYSTLIKKYINEQSGIMEDDDSSSEEEEIEEEEIEEEEIEEEEIEEEEIEEEEIEREEEEED